LNLDFERGPMILDDLRRLPPAPLVIADGSTVLPELVVQGRAERDRAVWLLPTFERHRAFHEKRGMAHLIEYRWLVAEEIARQAAEFGVNVLHVDNTVGIDEAFAAVEKLFADALAEGPRAETLEERRALLRYANEEVVTQARGYLARPWTTGDEATFVRDFLCECGDPECTEVVELAVADYAPRVSAHGRRVESAAHHSFVSRGSLVLLEARRARCIMYSARLSGSAVVRRRVGAVPLTGW